MALDSPSPLLVLPTDRQERWKLVREMIRQWFPADRSKLGLPLGMSPITAPPTDCVAIQEWFEIVREAPGIWCRQDHLFGESGDWRHGDYLEIAAENQVCAYWGVPRSELEQDDPPVFLNNLNHDGQWVLENTTVSEFALTWLASSIKWSRYNRGSAHGPVSEAARQIVMHRFPRLALTDWHWPVFPTQFYGTQDLLVEMEGDRDYIWLSASARTKPAFAEFKQLLDPVPTELEFCSDEWPDGWVTAGDDPQ